MGTPSVLATGGAVGLRVWRKQLHTKVEREIADRVLSFETGRVARQATCSVMVQYGGTVVLAAAVVDPEKTDFSFVPFAIDYMERSYAAGIIRGSRFNKREGRTTDTEILTARMIDRPLRPFFPNDYRADTRVQIMVFSTDNENDPGMLAMLGSAAALRLAPGVGLPAIGTAKVGRIDGQLILNPTRTQLDESDFHLVLSGTRERVTMIEFDGDQIPDDQIMEAISFGHEGILQTVDLIEELTQTAGNPAGPGLAQAVKPVGYDTILDAFGTRIREALCATSKEARNAAVEQLGSDIREQLAAEAPELPEESIQPAFEYATKRTLRQMAIEGQRCDGRGLSEVRPISCVVGILPKAHGSALFTRGQTQTLVATTIGTRMDEQRMEELTGQHFERFLVHYNFPPFCVGECGWIRGPSRRDIGHGYLARKGMLATMPSEEDFPYTIRVVSDVLESCASSSMATACGTTLSLMDAGVPIKAPVAGVSIGLVEEGDEVRFLTDIMDEEDFNGDMDFKVAATANGVTAIQMDVKNSGITLDMVAEALQHARNANAQILPIMAETLAEPKPLSRLAPRVVNVTIDPDLIGKVIGPGGATIRALVERTGAKIDIDDDGIVHISAENADGGDHAEEAIKLLAQEPKAGETYDGIVTSVRDFGAFVEILPETEGLLHISELSDEYVSDANDVVKVGDRIRVTVARVERGKVRLVREGVEPSERPESSPRRGPRRDDRGGDRPRSGSRPPRDRDDHRGGRDDDRPRGRSDGDRDRRDGPRDDRGRDRDRGGPRESRGRDGDRGRSQDGRGRDGGRGRSQDSRGRDGDRGRSQDSRGRDGDRGRSQDSRGRDGNRGRSQGSRGRDGDRGGPRGEGSDRHDGPRRDEGPRDDSQRDERGDRD